MPGGPIFQSRNCAPEHSWKAAGEQIAQLRGSLQRFMSERMDPKRAVTILERQRQAIEPLIAGPRSSPEFQKWSRDTEIAIARIFGDNSRHLEDFKSISYSLGFWTNTTPDSEFTRAFHAGLQKADAVLRSMVDEIKDYELGDDAPPQAPDQLTLLERVCLRFHAVCRQLQDRHSGRPTLSVDDEYDVQDLLHALLRLHFDDIRPEEWTPSYAGGGSRVDFLLKLERIVIEVKKTRASMKVSELGAQLIVDIARYERHPDCGTLVCFVYDPEGRIGNPVGLERDLEGHSGKLRVRVIVAPKS